MADLKNQAEINPTDRETIHAVEELKRQIKELAEFDKNCQTQLVNAARSDNNMLVAETKGMLRVTAMFAQQIAARIEQLK